MSSSGMGRDVHSLMLSIQHSLCRPRRRPPTLQGWFWRGCCEPTKELILLAKLWVVLRQILCNLAVAEEILMRISDKQVPSRQRVAPGYFKLVTSSNFWPFMLISALMSFVLLVMTLLFSRLTFISYAVTRSTSLLVRSPLLLPVRSMSLANRMLHVDFPPMEMAMWWSW